MDFTEPLIAVFRIRWLFDIAYYHRGLSTSNKLFLNSGTCNNYIHTYFPFPLRCLSQTSFHFHFPGPSLHWWWIHPQQHTRHNSTHSTRRQTAIKSQPETPNSIFVKYIVTIPSYWNMPLFFGPKHSPLYKSKKCNFSKSSIFAWHLKKGIVLPQIRFLHLFNFKFNKMN